jgi:hypothetical protein
MAKKKKKVCEACNGRGYLVINAGNVLKYVHGQDPKFYEMDKDLLEVQRCDSCDMLLNDDMAQDYFLDDVRKGRTTLPRLLLLWGTNEDVSRRTNG